MRLSNILSLVVLPPQRSDFEVAYLRRMNHVGLWFFALHLPAFVLIAFLNDTGPLLAAVLTSIVLVGPIVAYHSFRNPRNVSVVYGFTAMMMGGLLVHFGQGPEQIEMHFYFFALIAMLALYGNPMVIVTAAGTVALHHLVLWVIAPSSVFNYDAAIWVIIIHATFVVLESIGTIFIARSFFDNVIGLERIVAKRTSELDSRNHEMRLVLDTVEQGLVMVDHEGRMVSQGSAALALWFGSCAPGQSFEDYLRRISPTSADMFALAFDQLLEDVLPIELCVDMFPARLSNDKAHYGLRVTPITAGGKVTQLLVVISDITAQVERERLEAEQREMMALLDRVVTDRAGFVEFYEEADALISTIVSGNVSSLTLRRLIHTLKGNSMLFGAQSISELCHTMETVMEDEGHPPDHIAVAALQTSWAHLTSRLGKVLGEGFGFAEGRSVPRRASKRRVEVEASEIDALVVKAMRDTPRETLAVEIAELALEPTATRLRRVAEQARQIADRFCKGPLEIEIRDNGLHFDPIAWQEFWGAFVHVVRNAVDHGIELPDEREARGKPRHGTLTFETSVEAGEFVIGLGDDGRGIAWETVRQRAGALGLPAESREDAEEALFHDGISTAEVVTEYSGRGVGLGSIRAVCASRGGKIVVRSSSNGTTFQFRFPVAAMNPRCPVVRSMAA